MLLKMPQTAVNRNQAEGQIVNSLTNGLLSYTEDPSSDQIHLRLYSEDGAVRARRIGDTFLVLGWYTRHLDVDDESGPTDGTDLLGEVREGTFSGHQDLWGHSNAAIEFTCDDEHFEELDEGFFQELYEDLWENGLTPYELYESELAHYDPDSYPIEPRPSQQLGVAHWATDDSGNPIRSNVEFI